MMSPNIDPYEISLVPEKMGASLFYLLRVVRYYGEMKYGFARILEPESVEDDSFLNYEIGHMKQEIERKINGDSPEEAEEE